MRAIVKVLAVLATDCTIENPLILLFGQSVQLFLSPLHLSLEMTLRQATFDLITIHQALLILLQFAKLFLVQDTLDVALFESLFSGEHTRFTSLFLVSLPVPCCVIDPATHMFHLALLLLLLASHVKLGLSSPLGFQCVLFSLALLCLASKSARSLCCGHLLQVLQFSLLLEYLLALGFDSLFKDGHDLFVDTLDQSLLVWIATFAERLQEDCVVVVRNSDALPFHATEAIVFGRLVLVDFKLGVLLLFPLDFTLLCRSVQLDAFAGT